MKKIYGVFVWHENPRYEKEEAIKTYKSESSAVRFAYIQNNLPVDRKNYVVRDIYIEGGN